MIAAMREWLITLYIRILDLIFPEDIDPAEEDGEDERDQT